MAKRVDWNKMLEDRRFSLRVERQEPGGVLCYNTGVSDTTEKFQRRIKSDWDMDLTYNSDKSIREEYTKLKKSEQAAKGGRAVQEKHGKEICERLSKLPSWNIGKKLHYDVWHKGKSKHIDERLQAMSDSRTGSGNPMYNKRHTEETKRYLSDLVKSKIESGEWTPNIHNSRTHWQAIYNGQRYRSTWEAAYACLNPTHQYETLRIPYYDGDVKRIYIVDFIDTENKILVELKPSAHKNNKITRLKEQAAKEWCCNNDYVYVILTEVWLRENLQKIMSSDLDEYIKTRIHAACV